MAGENDITVDLDGSEDMDPHAVADAILEVERLVKSLESADGINLALTNLSVGSAHISMSATTTSLGSLREGMETLHQGFGVLRESAALPGGWRRETLQAVVSLGKVTSLRGVENIRLHIGNTVEQIDKALQSNAANALEPRSKSLGSVRGTLDRYTNDTSRKNRSAGLRRAGTDESILLRFHSDRAAQIREQLEGEVEVWGEIARDASDKIVHISVEGIEPMPFLPPASTQEGLGLLGNDWTHGIDPVEWVKLQRE